MIEDMFEDCVIIRSYGMRGKFIGYYIYHKKSMIFWFTKVI